MKVRTIHLKEGEQIEVHLDRRKVLRIGTECSHGDMTILVDMPSDEVNYNSMAGRRLNRQLEDK